MILFMYIQYNLRSWQIYGIDAQGNRFLERIDYKIYSPEGFHSKYKTKEQAEKALKELNDGNS